FSLFEPKGNLRYISNVDRAVTGRINDDIFNGIDRLELPGYPQQKFLNAYINITAGNSYIFALDSRYKVAKGKPVVFELRQVYIHLHLAFAPARQVHLQHRRNGFNAILQVFGNLFELHQAVLPRYVNLHNRKL